MIKAVVIFELGQKARVLGFQSGNKVSVFWKHTFSLLVEKNVYKKYTPPEYPLDLQKNANGIE